LRDVTRLGVLAALLLSAAGARATGADDAQEADACAPRTMRVTFYTCGEGTPPCLTKRGHMPLAFRTVAVGDRKLLGRWLWIEDLGGWVHATDTGGGLKRDSIDVFIGEDRMAPHARRLGVNYWTMRPCGPEKQPPARASAVIADAPRGAPAETPRAGTPPQP